jgi:hypothetical protein
MLPAIISSQLMNEGDEPPAEELMPPENVMAIEIPLLPPGVLND